MNRIGKINSGSPFWQGNQITARGKTKHLIMIEIHLRVFQKFIRASFFIQNANKLLYPFDFDNLF